MKGRALGVFPVLLAMLALIGWVQCGLSWHGLFLALAVQVGLMWWALYVLWAVPLPLRSVWFQARSWEPLLYRRLGVYAYMRDCGRWAGNVCAVARRALRARAPP